MTRSKCFFHAAFIAGITYSIFGCGPVAQPRVNLEAIPMQNAIQIVNNNLSKLNAAVRATGSVDCKFTQSNGKQRRVSLDGVLFFLSPTYLRLDLKKFGDRQILIGSNEEHYWYYSKEKDETFCGRHAVDEDWPENIPIHPDQLIDAIGFAPIEYDQNPGSPYHIMHRISEDHQELLLTYLDKQGVPHIAREYWLDRASPRLLRRVIFRNEMGEIDMTSELNQYVQLTKDGPWLPRSISIQWPTSKTKLHLKVNRWKLFPKIQASGPQFRTPKACNP